MLATTPPDAAPAPGDRDAAQVLVGPAGTVPATLSVVVCCYTMDRWDDVVRGLHSLADQRRRPDQVVVVVDHNDELLDRVRSLVVDVPLAVDVVTNAGQRGLSGARNTGVAASTGDVIAFLDDDASADPGWVADLLAGYRDPDVWGVGGAADPDWGGDAPAWFPAEFGWVVGCSYTGQPEQPAPVRNFLGCNMSFRREVFDEVGGFREGIGRVGTKPVGCEETELCIRLRQAHPEARLVYDPAVRVRHRVSADRHAFAYFRARCAAEGRSKAQVTDEVGAGDALATERAYTSRVLPAGVARGVRDALRGDGAGARRAGAITVGLVWTAAGYAAGRLGRGTS
ncbi:MAG: glycosyltransferase family 2 protein [Acidimicrobiales bacterium]